MRETHSTDDLHEIFLATILNDSLVEDSFVMKYIFLRFRDWHLLFSVSKYMEVQNKASGHYISRKIFKTTLLFSYLMIIGGEKSVKIIVVTKIFKSSQLSSLENCTGNLVRSVCSTETLWSPCLSTRHSWFCGILRSWWLLVITKRTRRYSYGFL